jgi:hypothetical protein
MMAPQVIANTGEEMVDLYSPTRTVDLGPSDLKKALMGKRTEVAEYGEIMADAWVVLARRRGTEGLNLIVGFLSEESGERQGEENLSYHRPLEAKSDTSSASDYVRELVLGGQIPSESQLRQARLMNIPTRGFCVSADLEKINADSYRHSYDPEEFAPPDI